MHFISQFTQMAVAEVYSTMLNQTVEARDAEEGDATPRGPVNGLIGSVGFAGKINGTLYMLYSDRLACRVTEALIGVTASDADAPEVVDVIGEIANMVSGAMKGHTSKRGYPGWLSTPVILRGEGITLESKDAPIACFNRFHFPNWNEHLEVWVFAKLEG